MYFDDVYIDDMYTNLAPGAGQGGPDRLGLPSPPPRYQPGLPPYLLSTV